MDLTRRTALLIGFATVISAAGCASLTTETPVWSGQYTRTR
jgi:hypothetical protein